MSMTYGANIAVDGLLCDNFGIFRFLKKVEQKTFNFDWVKFNIVLEECVFAKIVGTGVLDGPRYVKIFI